MSPVKCKEFPGFYEIPGFSKYCISKNSDILLKTKKKIINQYKVYGSSSSKKNTDTYLRVTMYSDEKKLRGIGVHRLMGIVFKYPKGGIEGLQVNHINGIKSDNRIENLEWVTCKKNIQLANLYYGAKVKIPVQLREAATGEIINFKCLSHAAKFLGIHRNTLIGRIERYQQYFVFPEGYSIRYGNEDTDWPKPINSDEDIETYKSKPLLLKDLITEEIIEVDKLKDAMKHIALCEASICEVSNNPSQPSVMGKNGHIFLVVKKYPPTRFRNVPHPYDDFRMQNKAFRPVYAMNINTNERLDYDTMQQCADDFGLLKTTLLWRLKKEQPRAYNGWIFRHL